MPYLNPFPFDLTVIIEDAEPWHDCAVTLSAFQAHIEVRGYDDYVLEDVRYRRLSDGAWVPPAQGGGLHLDMWNAASSKTGQDAIEAAIASKIEDLRVGAMARRAA